MEFKLLDLGLCERMIRQERRLPEPICDAVLDEMNATRSSTPNLILLIFALCGNIRSLEVSGCPYIWATQAKRHGIVKQARKMKDALSAEGGFPFMDIQHVNLISDGSCETSLTKSHLSVFLDLPHIQTLTTDYLGPGDRGPDPFIYYAHPSRVKEIRIKNFQAKMEYLTHFLLSCIYVETLSVESAIASDANLGYEINDMNHSSESDSLDDFSESDSLDDFTSMRDDNNMSGGSPHLYKLRRNFRLSHLTLTESALYGRKARSDLWDSDGEYHDSEEDEPTVPRFAELLPPSLKTLTISCEGRDVRSKAEAFLNDSYASTLDDLVVMNAQKSHWFSKASSEGGVDPVGKWRQRYMRRSEDAAW